jgi:hypothetical protein
MVKRNKNNNRRKKKQPMVRSANRTKSIRNRSQMNNMSEMTCSNLDPFCPAAIGAKLYDENTAKSLTYQSRDVQTFSSNGQGQSMVYFTCAPVRASSSATIVANVTTAWGAWTTNTFFGGISSACGKWRVVSWGIHIISIAPYNTASGSYVISEVTEDMTANVGQNVAATNYGGDSVIAMIPGNEFYLVGKPLGSNATTYTQGVGTNVLNAYTGFVIVVNGMPINTPTYTAELIVNYEWIPTAVSSGYNNIATRSAPSVPAVMDARSNAAGLLPLALPARSPVAVSHTIMDTVDKVLNVGTKVLGMASMFYPPLRPAAMIGAGVRSMLRNDIEEVD